MGCARAQKTTKQAYNSECFGFFLSPQYSQPAYMPATSLLFSGMLICIFASILGGHEGSVGTSGGQKMAKNRMKPL